MSEQLRLDGKEKFHTFQASYVELCEKNAELSLETSKKKTWRTENRYAMSCHTNEELITCYLLCCSYTSLDTKCRFHKQVAEFLSLKIVSIGNELHIIGSISRS